MRKPGEPVRRAVQLCSVVVTVNAVHVGCKRLHRDIRILEPPWRGSRHEIDQRLIIAVLGEWKIGVLSRAEFNVYIGGFRLQPEGTCRDGNLLGDTADLAAAAGTDDSDLTAVAGLRAWF